MLILVHDVGIEPTQTLPCKGSEIPLFFNRAFLL